MYCKTPFGVIGNANSFKFNKKALGMYTLKPSDEQEIVVEYVIKTFEGNVKNNIIEEQSVNKWDLQQAVERYIANK